MKRKTRVVMNPAAGFRKSVHEISDRAKRYRANRPEVRPELPKICATCGSDRNVGVGHIDGDENNGKRSNLEWTCKRCNALLAVWMKRRGLGERVNQSNPAKKKRKPKGISASEEKRMAGEYGAGDTLLAGGSMLIKGFRDAEAARVYYTRQRGFAVKLTIAVKRLLAAVLPDAVGMIAEDIPSIICEWFCANCDAAIVDAGELEKASAIPLYPPGYAPPSPVEQLANLVAERDSLIDSIGDQESAIGGIEVPGLQEWIRTMTIRPLRSHLAAIEGRVQRLQADIEDAEKSGGFAPPAPLYPGGGGVFPPGLYPGIPAAFLPSQLGGEYTGSMSSDKSKISDVPVDHKREEVPVTYRKAQSVQRLFNGLLYNSPDNTDGIMLNPRNSGNPSTAGERVEWTELYPDKVIAPAIDPSTFKPIDPNVVAAHDSDNFNYNKDSRVLLLVLRKDVGPVSVVMTADDFLDETGKLIDPAEADSLLIKRFDPSNALNK